MTDEEIMAEAMESLKNVTPYVNYEERVSIFIAGAKWNREQSEKKLKIAMDALNNIACPILYLQNKAEQQGAKLDGHNAVRIIENKHLYITIAKDAIEQLNAIIEKP